VTRTGALRASVGSTEASDGRLARVGRIDRRTQVLGDPTHDEVSSKLYGTQSSAVIGTAPAPTIPPSRPTRRTGAGRPFEPGESTRSAVPARACGVPNSFETNTQGRRGGDHPGAARDRAALGELAAPGPLLGRHSRPQTSTARSPAGVILRRVRARVRDTRGDDTPGEGAGLRPAADPHNVIEGEGPGLILLGWV